MVLKNTDKVIYGDDHTHTHAQTNTEEDY